DDLHIKAGERALQGRATEILDGALAQHLAVARFIPIDASIFIDRIARHAKQLREEIRPALSAKLAGTPALRKRVRALSAAQGILDFVTDLDVAIAGQYAYRLIGQILFYFALRRRQASLPPLAPAAGTPLIRTLRPFWDDVRRFDYEAMFERTELDDIV